MATDQPVESEAEAIELLDDSAAAPTWAVIAWLRRFFWIGREDSRAGISPGEWTTYSLIILIAGVMRLWDLGSRALHHDESLHSYFSWELFNSGTFAHNPMMHGPLQFEANAAIFFLLGDSDFTSRILYAVMGTILVAMPILLRTRLGKLGAVLVSAMLAFSPALLYFSRFARNDILMAAWTVGLIACMWRYMDDGKHRYLYFAAGLLAFAFATKETAYLVTAILGLFLFVIASPDHWRNVRINLKITSGETSPPDAAPIGLIVSGIWSYLSHGMDLSKLSRSASFLLLLITITLPQWSAAVSIFQNTALLSWSNLTLANPDTINPIGAASGGGIVIAFLVVVAMLGISAYLGFKWRWGVWWRCAIIFYVIWVMLYSTFFTNWHGLESGVWQGLGYWIAQQDVARGNQPWYYYLVITPVYEYLPLFFGAIAAVYYTRRKDAFGRFLASWVVATFILYTIASEKMPWLLVNISLPLIVISGKFIGEIIQRVDWRRVVPTAWLLFLIGVPLFFVALWRLALFGVGDDPDSGLPMLAGLLVALAVLIAGGIFITKQVGGANFFAFSVIPLFLLLFALSVRTGWTASFQNGDTPVEMLVYTQTSPDITQLMRDIQTASDASEEKLALPITIDQTSGYTWPWAWYLRDFTKVNYPTYENTPLTEAPDSPMVLVHTKNQAEADEILQQDFDEATLIKHRWWFPESTYRSVTPSKFLSATVDRESWKRVMDYWLNREGVFDRIGSEDAYLYRQPGFPRTIDDDNGS